MTDDSRLIDLTQGLARKVATRLYAAGAEGLTRSKLQRGLYQVDAATLTEALAVLDGHGLVRVVPPKLKPRGWGLNPRGRPATLYAWASDSAPDDLWPRVVSATSPKVREPTVSERLTNIETMLAALLEALPSARTEHG